MNDLLKKSFGEIHAEEDLKATIRCYLKEQAYLSEKKKKRPRLVLASAICSVLLLGFLGGLLYFSPVSAISIDMNPSLELALNRFDRVIAIKGRNDDGTELKEKLDVKYLNYSEAIQRFLENDAVTGYLSQGERLEITVAGETSEKGERLLSNIKSCIQGKEGEIACYSLNRDEVETAHDMGLSFGKYRTFLELQQLDPDITAEEAAEMTMKQMRERIKELSSTESKESRGQNGDHRGDSHFQQKNRNRRGAKEAE